MATSRGTSSPVISLQRHSIVASPSASAIPLNALSALGSISKASRWKQHFDFHRGKPGKGSCGSNFLLQKGNNRPVLAQAQCSTHSMAAMGGLDQGSARSQQPVALLSCGSFNPPTVMHLRMFDLARFALEEVTTPNPHDPQQQDALLTTLVLAAQRACQSCSLHQP